MQKPKRFYIDLRRDLVGVYQGIKNAEPEWHWIKPVRTIKQWVTRMLRAALVETSVGYCFRCLGCEVDRGQFSRLEAHRNALFYKHLSRWVSAIHAEPFFWLDNIPFNSEIRRRLIRLLDTYLSRSEQYGLYIVTGHEHCGGPRHKRASEGQEYVMEKAMDKSITYKDQNYEWLGPIGREKVFTTCPCSKSDKRKEHFVTQFLIFTPDANHTVCKILYQVFDRITRAIEEAGYHKPRSSIREQLLLALLVLNDAILPMTVEDYIQKEAPA